MPSLQLLAARARPTRTCRAARPGPKTIGRARRRAIRHGVLALALVAGAGGCSFAPPGTDAEKNRLADVGERYEPPFEQRSLPEVPAEPAWPDLLHRAFMANGEVEAAYFEWKAAVERIGIASAWPNSRIMLGYSYALGPGQMKTFDRMTFSAGIDTMANLSFPSKTAQDGKIALDEARAAGERFRIAKFALQEGLLSAWADHALLAERIRIQRQHVALLRLTLDTARTRVQAGGPQEDLLRAEVGLRMAEDALRAAESELAASRAMLNGVLAREPDAPLVPPPSLPPARAVPADDAMLLAAAADRNPELAALGRGVEGRADALERARLEWIPDINPSIAFTGGVAQIIGATVVLPTTIRQIEGGIREAESMLRASEATLRQGRRDKAAMVVATLVNLRDAERQAALFESTIIPATARVATTVRERYAAGQASYLDLIDAQRAVLDTRLVFAQARTMREKRLAELEALIGLDVETLGSTPGAISLNAANTANPTPPGEPGANDTETDHDH